MKLPEESLSGTGEKDPLGRSSAVGLSERGEEGELDRCAEEEEEEETGLKTGCLDDFVELADVSFVDSIRLEGERFFG